MFNRAEKIKRYLRPEMYPSIFCVGCGIGNVLNYTLRAIDECRLDFDKVVFLSGIGCSSIQIPGSRFALTSAFMDQITPISRPTLPKASSALSICTSSCAADICVRIRALPFGTTG